MEKIKKEQVVQQLREVLNNASSCITMDFSGVKTDTFSPMRKECIQSNVKMTVVKNTLARIATKDTPYEGLADHLKGMTCFLCTMDRDQVVGAKTVKKFAEKDKNITIKCGMLDGRLLNADQVKALSELPSKEELQARLLATMLAVPQNFVRLLNAVPSSFVRVLAAYRDKKENA
jgi:large subunit ribosomal protein L10